jgi:hypothetical protein
MDADFGAQLERTFTDDLLESHEITAEEWSRRGFLTRARSRFWVMFAEQF